MLEKEQNSMALNYVKRNIRFWRMWSFFGVSARLEFWIMKSYDVVWMGVLDRL